MAVNNVIHNISADATDLNYADSNLTLFKHDLFESNNEWSIVRKDETTLKLFRGFNPQRHLVPITRENIQTGVPESVN